MNVAVDGDFQSPQHKLTWQDREAMIRAIAGRLMPSEDSRATSRSFPKVFNQFSSIFFLQSI